VPANTSATLYLPVEASSMEGFAAAEGVVFEGMTKRNGREVARLKLLAGEYKFTLSGDKWAVK
jgi:alpha-L-rhamnosidase